MHDKADLKTVKKKPRKPKQEKMGYSLMWNVDKTKRYVLENKFCTVVNNF